MTENHGYDTPQKGTADWHVPLNDNFEKLDADVEIRDREEQLDSYQPKQGAKFFATDTGRIYLGDGTAWTRIPVQPHGHDRLTVDSLRLPVRTSDPEAPEVGQIWYRNDDDQVKVETASGPRALTFETTVSESDDSVPSADPYVVVDFEDDYRNQFTQVDEWNDQNRQLVTGTRNGGTSLRVDMNEGNHWGTNLRYQFGAAGHDEPEELYARYYLYFESDFEAIRGGGKLPGPAGAYGDAGSGGNPSDGTNGWSARGTFEPEDRNADPLTVPIKPSYYTYHADMEGTYGDRFHWDVSLERGRWYQVDQYVRMNTPGRNDGVLRAWIDESKVFDRGDLSFRNAGYDNIKIEAYWLTAYYGGSWSSPSDNSIYFDDLTLSPDPLL